MLGFGKNDETELNNSKAGDADFDFGKFRKSVSEAADSVVDAVNEMDLTKGGKKSKQAVNDLPGTMSLFFTAAADALANRSSVASDNDSDDESDQSSLGKVLSNTTGRVTNQVKNAQLDKKASKLLDQANTSWGGLSDSVKGSVKNAQLDKKASDLFDKAGNVWGGLGDSVSSSVKDAQLDKKASNLLGFANDTWSGLSDNVSGTVKNAQLDKKMSNLTGVAGDTLGSVAGTILPAVATVGGVIADTAVNVAGTVADTAKDVKLAEVASNLGDSVTSFVKDNKLDKKAAQLLGKAGDARDNLGSTLKDSKLDEKLLGAFNLVPGVEIKNPKKAAKQFRKRRDQALKKVAVQQRELGKALKVRQKQANEFAKARLANGKLSVPSTVPSVKTEQKQGFGFPWKTVGSVGLISGGVAANNARIWSNVPPLESKLPGDGKFYRSRQGMIFYKEAGEVTGDEHPVVMVHGIGAGAHSYEWLQNYGEISTLYKTYAYDLLGFGNSERPNFDYTAEVYIKQLTEFLDEVVGQPAYVIASSLSASYAVQVAYRRPELIAKLLLVEPTGMDAATKSGGPQVVSDTLYSALRAPVVGKGIYSYVASHAGIRQFMQNQMFFDKSIVTNEMVEQYWISAHQNGAEYAVPAFFTGRLNAEIVKTIGKLDIPILSVFGQESRITPPQEAGKLTRENKAAQVKVLDGARLSVNWERAKEFNALALDFLDNLNQTNVGSESRVHELKVSDITGAGFIHPGTANDIENLKQTHGGEVVEAATEAKNSGKSKQKSTYQELSNQEAQPDQSEQDGEQPQAQG